MRTIGILIWKEYLHIARDRATLFQVLMIPMLQLVVLSFAATFRITSTDVFLVDQDQSAVSRGLVTRLAGTGYFDIVGSSFDPEDANAALMRRDATMVLRIPRGFEDDIVKDRQGSVQIALNSEQGAAAGIVRSYAIAVLNDYGREMSSEVTAATGGRASGVGGGIRVSTRSWYNPTLRYLDYMVPGLMVALVTIIGTLLTAQNIAREKELGTLEQLNVTPLTRVQFIAGKLLPFWLLAIGELTGGLLLARFVFDIPFRGNVLLVYGIAAIYLGAALGMGLLISTLAETQQQAMFVTFFVMMIYLLMSGLYTPVSSMPDWVQTVAEINPGKHFVGVMRSVLLRGARAGDLLDEVLALSLFAAAALSAAVLRYHKRTG